MVKIMENKRALKIQLFEKTVERINVCIGKQIFWQVIPASLLLDN
jgi:hypothetical protein